MANLFLVVLCLVAGWILRSRLDPNALNRFALLLSLPALSFVNLHRVGEVHWIPVFSAWLVFIGAAAFLSLMGRLWGWSSGTVACLILTAGLSNTSFVGFPLLEALLGKESLTVGVQIDQLGSFLVLSVPGVMTAARASGREWSFRKIALEVLSFIPLYAAVLGLLLRSYPLPTVLEEALARLGATLTPVALVSVGTRIRLPSGSVGTHLFWGLLYKLALAPLLILGFLRLTGVSGLEGRTTLLEAAMAPMVTGAILASEHELAPELASAMVSVGVPLSLLTVWAWSLWGG